MANLSPCHATLLYVNGSCILKCHDDLADAADGQPKSRFEMLAEQRDYKRRRQSYRAKNVHITKRSAVEVRITRSPTPSPSPTPWCKSSSLTPLH